MRSAKIKILHKQKGADNLVSHVCVFEGICKVSERFSVREQQGGVENNSEITALIFTHKPVAVSCGDRCLIDGAVRSVRKVSRCGREVSAPFRHISLKLR